MIAPAWSANHFPLQDYRQARWRGDGCCLQGEALIGFTGDGRSLFVYKLGEVPGTVYKLDLATGHKQLWKQLVPPDVSGVTDITPDGNNYVYEYGRTLSDLYLVNDLK